MKRTIKATDQAGGAAKAQGFSLLELLVATAVFMLIAGTAFTLFSKQELASELVQGQVGLNIALRNAATQLQIDLANAGSGYFQGSNVPSWPVGVTIVNNVVASGSSCYNSGSSTYGASCFDQVNIIAAANPATYPPVNATDSSGAAGVGNCSNTNTGIAYGQAASGLTLAQTAAKFSSGDQLLFLTSTGNYITSVVLTAAPTVAGSAVKFTFNATLDQTVSSINYKGYNALAHDPLDITACDGLSTCSTAAQGQPGSKLGEQFCGTDWILKLAPITYQVDLTTPSNPKLTRTQNGSTVTVMEQVVGFKVGAAIWNAASGTDATSYNYAASTYTNSTANDMAYNFTLVRSVRVSLIGRTTPSTDPNYKFRNAFDNGAYQVQGTAVVVNPRDMSMND
ncbi:MAG: type II secretion system protein J [Terriglobales bacterium]